MPTTRRSRHASSLAAVALAFSSLVYAAPADNTIEIVGNSGVSAQQVRCLFPFLEHSVWLERRSVCLRWHRGVLGAFWDEGMGRWTGSVQGRWQGRGGGSSPLTRPSGAAS